jgi:hypothetical protein
LDIVTPFSQKTSYDPVYGLMNSLGTFYRNEVMNWHCCEDCPNERNPASRMQEVGLPPRQVFHNLIDEQLKIIVGELPDRQW